MKNDRLYKEVIRFCIKNENRFGIFCFKHSKLTFSVEKNKFCHKFFIDANIGDFVEYAENSGYLNMIIFV